MSDNGKLEEWATMNFSEKQKFNGYKGFCHGELFKDSNAFMREDKERLKRRLVKEKKHRDLTKLNEGKNE